MFDLLVAAASATVTRWRQDARPAHAGAAAGAGNPRPRRRPLVDERDATDTSDTVGLLSAIYPLRVDSTDPRHVGKQLAAIPGDGVDYGLLRYLRADTACAARRLPRAAAAAELSRRTPTSAATGLTAGPRAAGRGVAAARARPGGAPRADHHGRRADSSGSSGCWPRSGGRCPTFSTDADIAALQELWDDSLREMAI